ncbi:CSMD1 [Branchiostoma lanceolatum]|uniref:CSMD1 protein n=1 Tax=Branchiostoma lanceolatum TaxID=7740 RepID=A0A8K0EW27_BRALA|nr:CSMD1 [Branchiostoma lanceolatum]
MCIIVHSRGHGKRAQLSSLLMLTCGLPPSEQLITDPITDKLDLAHYREVFRLYVLSLVLGSSFNPLTSGTHPHVWFRHMHATLRSEPVHGMALQLEIFAWAVLTFYVYTISADNEGVCVPSTAAAAAEGRGCGRKRCAADSDCRGRNKRCLCDGPCGMSCVNPNGTCREPQAPSNGAVEVDQLWFGGLAVYSCDDGHVLSGQAQRQCTGDREWSWQTPECMKNVTTCGEPPDVDHAMYDGERRRVSFDVGERLLYRCNSGFFRIGQPYVRCGENGQWSAVQLTCKARSCGNPGELANGRRDGLLFTYPNRVQYRCNQGYTLVGRPVRVCLSTQQWSGSLPRCQPVSCPVLQHPENGHRFGTDVTYNKVVKFTCSTGYIVRGSAERTCGADGTWSGEEASCAVINCGEPDPVWNGFWEGSDYGHRAEVSFSCRRGFLHVGAMSAVCQDDETWSSPSPHCFGKCEIERPPSNGYFSSRVYNGQLLSHGDTVEVACDTGYQLDGDRVVTCDNGTLALPTCNPRPCDDVPVLVNGEVDVTGLAHGSRATFRCVRGFRLDGPSQTTCYLGTWQTLSSCKHILCPQLDEIVDDAQIRLLRDGSYESFFQKDDLTQGAEVLISCTAGTTLQGSRKAECDNGLWVYRGGQGQPFCSPDPCPVNGVNIQSDHPDEVGHAERVTFRCAEGFEAEPGQTQTTLTCERGQWTPHSPTCTEAWCPLPKKIDHGAFRPDVQFVASGGDIELVCDVNYAPSRQSGKTRCRQGRWSTQLPTCLYHPEPCVLPDLPHGTYLGNIQAGNRLSHQETVTYRCSQGPSQDMTAQCYEGNWRSQPPHCSQGCKSGYTFFHHGCYKISSDTKSHGEARDSCRRDGAELVAVRTQAVHDFLVRRLHAAQYWIGLRDSAREGSWLYADGSPLGNFNMWGDGQPSGNWWYDEDCVAMHKPDSYRWHDFYCSKKYRYICQYTILRDDLGLSGFEKFSGAALLGHNNVIHEDTAVEECANQCQREVTFNCLSFDYNVVSRVCQLSSENRWTVGGDFDRNSLGWDHYERSVPCEPPIINNKVVSFFKGKEITVDRAPQFVQNDMIVSRCFDIGKYTLRGSVVRTCINGRWNDTDDPSCDESLVKIGFRTGRGKFFVRSQTDYGHFVVYPAGVFYLDCDPLPNNYGSPVFQKNGQDVYPHVVRQIGEDYRDDSGRIKLVWSRRRRRYYRRLMFNPPQPQDTGTYTCYSDKYPQVKHSVKIHVEAVTCPDPGIPAGSRRSGSSYYVDKFIMNEHVTYSCQEGFLLQGAPDIWCRWDGTWSDTPPTCAAMVSCPVPAVPDNGEMRGRTFSVDSTVSFSCRPGFTLSGPREITCLTDGQWSDNFPTCNVISYECAVPELSENVVNTSPKASYNVGDTIIFTCRPNFVLSGEETLRCMADLTWSADPPQCQADADEATSRPRPRTLCGDRVCDVWEKCDNKTSSHWRCICIRPQDCPRGGMRVCSKDGTVFENRCRLMAADCLPNYSFQFSHITEDGECTADEAQGASGDAASSTGRGAQPGGRAGVAFDPVQTTPADVELTTFSETEEIFSDLRIPDMNGQR